MDLSDLLPGGDAGDLKGVIDVITRNKDVLDKLDKLPGLLRGLADDLDNAGGEAHSASLALVGEDGHSGARRTLTDAAAALRGISGNVTSGAGLIKDAGDLAGKVPLMDGPAGKLTDTGDNLAKAGSGLGDLATALDSTADVLEKVAAALGRVGDRLKDSSSTIHGFVD